jgi:predicted MFS family arabinose efflux permease
VAAEVFPSHLRADGTAISIALVTAADILWLQLAPTAASTIGWKYYLVFIALGIVHIIYFWFKLPEVSDCRHTIC